MHLQLAGWQVELRVSPHALAEAAAARCARFIAPPTDAPDLVVTVQNEAPRAAGEADDAGILHATLTAEREDYLLDGPTFYGIIEPTRGTAALRMRSGHPAREVEYFLRIALALFALRRDGLLLHCAALLRTGKVFTDGGDGQVCLFVGQSGSGKSTVVALAQAAGRATALGDDLILLRREQSGWRAYGTPFWNFDATQRTGEAGTGLVAGIYKLIQAPAVFVEPMSRTAAAAELLANCPIVNDQPALLPVLIDRCHTLASEIGVQRLHFRKDDAFLDVIAREVQ